MGNTKTHCATLRLQCHVFFYSFILFFTPRFYIPYHPYGTYAYGLLFSTEVAHFPIVQLSSPFPYVSYSQNLLYYLCICLWATSLAVERKAASHDIHLYLIKSTWEKKTKKHMQMNWRRGDHKIHTRAQKGKDKPNYTSGFAKLR